MKQRDYQSAIVNSGFETATKQAIDSLIDEVQAVERDLKECGNQLLQIAKLMEDFTKIAGNMKDGFDQLSKKIPNVE